LEFGIWNLEFGIWNLNIWNIGTIEQWNNRVIEPMNPELR
jgi:hypothetical protein